MNLFDTVSSHETSPGKALAKSRDDSNGTGHVGKSGICGEAPSSKKHDGFLGGESNKEEPVTLDQKEAPKKEVDYSQWLERFSCTECRWLIVYPAVNGYLVGTLGGDKGREEKK